MKAFTMAITPKRGGEMLAKACGAAVVAGLMALCWASVYGQTGAEVAAAPKDEVTITGSLMCDWATLPSPKSKDFDYTSPEHGLLVIYAIDGSPEIRSEVEKVTAEYYPDKGLDGDEAQKLLDQWTARLKYTISKDSPAGEELYKRRHSEQSFAFTLAGVISEKDGKKWITVSKATPVDTDKYAEFYPRKMHTPDKPFVMPDKEPLLLKVTDTLTLKCIKLPAGKYLEGSFFFMHQRFVEEYPHMVTLTRPFYLAEIPVTQEVWEAVMGNNPSTHKDPKLPVENPQCLDIQKFCRILSEKNGRKVRLPTDAEWEYANRTGTSNPPLVEKYQTQYCGLPGRMVLPVKSKQPNAWGLYDMASAWWEFVADKGFYNPRTPQVDPFYPPNCADPRHQHRGRGLWQYNHSGANVEFMPGNPDPPKNMYASETFRVAADAEPLPAAQPK